MVEAKTVYYACRPRGLAIRFSASALVEAAQGRPNGHEKWDSVDLVRIVVKMLQYSVQ